MGELPSDCCSDLCHILDRIKPIETGRQRGLQRRRYRKRRQRSVKHVTLGGLVEDSTLEEGPRQLLDEQGHAIGMRKDLVQDSVGQRFAPSDAANDAGAVATSKAA